MIADTATRLAAPGPNGAALQALGGAERLLWEASERALRQPRGAVALVLHLSRLAPPAPRAYHIRVARVLMQDSAARFGGQVFAMRNQDLVLLCTQQQALSPFRSPAAGPAKPMDTDAATTPETLPVALGKLFAADVAEPAQLTSFWRLERDSSALIAYLTERASGPAPAETPEEPPPNAILSLAAVQGILSKAPLADLMLQQTGMSLSPDRGRSLADRLAPAFRELELSLAALNLGPVVSQATADPFLFRHLASGFDARVIQLLADDLAAQGRLTRASVQAGLPIHIDLGLDAILSPGFARLSRQAGECGVTFGASVSIMQACADLDLMDHARHVLKLTGAQLVLSRVDPAALGMIVPAALQPDLLKLIWTPALLTGPAMAGNARQGGLLGGIDPSRIVLQAVDSQLALAWGQAHGITLFQGPFLDQVQAATRMARCHSAAACTLRQCSARGSAVGLPGRVGCGNPALLDGRGVFGAEHWRAGQAGAGQAGAGQAAPW